ncbi:hypothetical protein RD792_002190 [Penstemon davidsonii]|uniref:Dirigent protein n=1 Tax=Penstemon davidsonii TaxID=160366 RepID=A0ABR0DR81_9LAMI|nr:hypothetical protein RD792_002190 [Penstemon davidsonii]
MEKKSAVLACILVLNICTSISLVKCEYYSQSLPYNQVKEHKTSLHFYIHDIVSGSKPTAVPIARPKSGQGGPGFGQLFAIDDPLTEGPEITSTLIGNARGMYVSASQDAKPTLVMYMDLGFTSGKFNGSSISVFSRNPITESPREMAIVGGRGLFRFAKGYITVHTHSLSGNGDAVLEYNAEIVHP